MNQKSALGLLSKDRSILVQSAGFNPLPHLIPSRKSDKSNVLSGNRGYLPNQIKHVVATSDLLPARAGMLLWHDTAFCKKCLIGPACNTAFVAWWRAEATYDFGLQRLHKCLHTTASFTNCEIKLLSGKKKNLSRELLTNYNTENINDLFFFNLHIVCREEKLKRQTVTSDINRFIMFPVKSRNSSKKASQNL